MYYSRKGWNRKFKAMPNSKKYYFFFRTYAFHGIEQVELYYNHLIDHGNGNLFIEQMDDFMDRCTNQLIPVPTYDYKTDTYTVKTVSLGDCKPCTAPILQTNDQYYKPGEWINKEEGNNPMYPTKTCGQTAASSVSINVPETKSDEMTQREYLLEQLRSITSRDWDDESWIGQAFETLRKKYHIGAPNIPRTTQEVLDAFKNKRIEIDQKKVDRQTDFFKARDSQDYDSDDYEYTDGIESRYYGLKFLDLPVEDRAGYDKACKALRDLVKKTEREITIFSPEHGLKALMALEAHTIH